jgi:hypothetical protein
MDFDTIVCVDPSCQEKTVKRFVNSGQLLSIVVSSYRKRSFLTSEGFFAITGQSLGNNTSKGDKPLQNRVLLIEK